VAYDDSRLVELYDTDNPDGSDHDFYRLLADEVAASSILDLGCGTGMLTVSLTSPERVVVGVDPSPAMLAFAQARPGGERVQWVRGDSRGIPRFDVDYAVMTGNVAQHIGEGDWSRTLRDLRRAMRPGATLAFETRNPVARAWEHWSSPERSTRATEHGRLVEWMSAEETAPGTVRIRAFNHFADIGETVVEDFELRFRGRATVEDDLESAGFELDAVYGDWNRTRFQDDDPLMVFVAHAR
jgi:SAM-dependent methyltransferase